MPHADETWDALGRHHRPLAHYLRTLLSDAADAEPALGETVLRLRQTGFAGPDRACESRGAGVAREVATARRKAATRLPFSDDLFRQLADVPRPPADRAEGRARALAESLAQLPPPDRELLRRKYGMGLTVGEIASADGRPPAAVIRDLASVHENLLSAVRAAVPDDGPEPPGGAADLGRMADQLLDGTITDDGRVVLETLLLADVPAQAHYARHAALIVDLTWAYRGEPPLPELPAPPAHPAPLSSRERALTAAFIAACVAVALFVLLVFSGRLP